VDKNLRLRLTSGAVYVLLIYFACTSFGSLTLAKLGLNIQQSTIFYGLMMAFLAVSVFEAIQLTKLRSISWILLAVAGVAFVLYRYSVKFLYQTMLVNIPFSEFLSLLLIVLAAITVFKAPQELRFDNGKAIFVVIYLGLPFGMILALPSFNNNPALMPVFFSSEVFYLFLLIWASDSMAFVCGKLMGKRKFAPSISPNKTWEGVIGGFLCTIAIGFVVEMYNPTFQGHWAIIGFIVGVFGPLGDLLESKLKRYFNVKDSGKIMPGHGGILDRLDSFIACAPMVYLYLILDKIF
jgi:phosphatidate cytidylyltransferase